MYVLNLYSQDDSLRSEVAKLTKSTFNVCRKLLSLLYLCITSQKMILPGVKVKKEHRCSFFWQCEKCCFESVHWICWILSDKIKCWRCILCLSSSESECRRKWKMLRDQHRRERQREKERRESGVGLFNYRPWRYSAILSFLNPFIDARAAGTNGWALNPQPPRFGTSDMVGCSTTTETRSDDDENYGVWL